MTKTRKLLYRFSLFLVVVPIFIGCQNKEKKPQHPAGDSALLLAPINREIHLDSTVVGTQTVIDSLEVPWEIAWGPDNWIWFTEQAGRVSKVNPRTGKKMILLEIPNVFKDRTTGLLGMAIAPNFGKNPFVFLNYTYKDGDSIFSKLVRYTFEKNKLVDPKDLLNIPGGTSHNGTRLTIAPDGKIMWATGDNGPEVYYAQDVKSLNGKILRLNTDGTIPDDNPFPNSPVWSWGHRNHQGLVYGRNNNLYTSEHGPATDDEINLIQKGGNYGWPFVMGFCDTPKEMKFCKDSAVIEPLKAWTPTIAPSGIDYYDSPEIPEWRNSILLATLKGNDFRVLKLNEVGTKIIDEKIFLDHELGRLRDICISPRGDVYISTSNRDWNPGEGYPKPDDDKIIRIFKLDKGQIKLAADQHAEDEKSKAEKPLAKNKNLYTQYCASCHKPDGNGVAGTFPPLSKTKIVLGDKDTLITIIVNGLNKPIKVRGAEYNQAMPAFDFLSDDEISQILTYIRSNFGNSASAVSSKEVENARE